jgi:hypothetical protein
MLREGWTLTDCKRPEGTMRQGSVTYLVRGQTTDAGYLCGEGKAARPGTVHYEVASEIPSKVPRVS